LGAPGGGFEGSSTMVNLLGIEAPSFVFDLVLSAGGGATRYYFGVGTSQASPAAAGVAALIVGKYGGKLSPAQLESKLKSSAVDMGKPGKDKYFGHGQVNAANAVRQ
jgi:subtilisin family serine protease